MHNEAGEAGTPQRAEAQRRVLLAADSETSAESGLALVRRMRPGAHIFLQAILAAEDVSEAVPAWARELGDEGVTMADAARMDSIRPDVKEAAQLLKADSAVLVLGADALTVRSLRRLIAEPPCEMLVLLGVKETTEAPRILLATNTYVPLSQSATELTYRLIPPGGSTHVDFLRLVENGATEEQDRIAARLRERIAERNPDFSFDVLIESSRTIENGVLHALHGKDDYDLVILDAPRPGIIGRLSQRVLPERLVKRGVPLLLYVPAVGRFERAFTRMWNRVYDLVPSVSEADRVTSYARIRRNSRSSDDFDVLLALSTLIASFGLLLGSPAVVIGAMIIAPLMQPIVGVGLGLATANTRLIRSATTTVVRGALLAFLLSFLVGLAIPSAGVTDELNARGQPTTLDLLVALGSGAAGAYASARRGAASSAAGVAVAVALIPPISTVGIGVAIRDDSLAVGATLLFVTNVAAVCAMSATMYLWMGFKPETGRFGRFSSPIPGVLAAAALVGVVGLFLFARSEAADHRFQAQALAVVEIAVQGIDPESDVSDLVVESNGDVVVLSARVRSSQFAEVLAATPLIQSDVTRQLERPTVIRLREAPAPRDED